MTPRDAAKQGLTLLKDAVLAHLNASKIALPHSEIVRQLGLESDFEGNGRNYLSWSVLGLLVNAGQVRYQGERHERVYYVREDQL
jgi:uncharacterized protein